MFHPAGNPNNVTEHELTSIRSRVQICHEHGFYVSFLLDSGERTSCALCAAQRKTEIANGKLGWIVVGSWTVNGNIPVQFVGVTLSDFLLTTNSQCQSLGFLHGVTRKWADDDFEDCGQIFLLGDRETGKSHIAVAMLHSLSANKNVFYRDVSEGCGEFPDNVDILVLDNLFADKASLSDGGKQFWNKLILSRAVRELPTIMVTSASRETVRQSLYPKTLHWLRMNRAKIVHLRERYSLW